MLHGFHKFSVMQKADDLLNSYEVMLDGKKVRATGYKVEQGENSIPTVTITLQGYSKMDFDAGIETEDSEVQSLCYAMTLENLKTFVGWWNLFHNASLELVDTTSRDDVKTSQKMPSAKE